ncbi:glycosyltransferase family 9 protein [Paraburkholderia sp. J41]|uniref:glycosyltransferase family 9 protein n=1 Tax=Paraburkholderia sp. J41 TaxID=2805433 RepID=UPI002AC317E4|nr:glycosyltransferase family 9 protein [Paraburkholderia sp. J41]
MPTMTDSPAPQSIVVFRALQLGDMLCSVPAFRALRAAYPHARIALVGLPWARTFVARYPALLDEFIAFPGARGFPEQPEDERDLPAFLDAMCERRFDLAIQLHGSGGVANTLVRGFGARAMSGFMQPRETPPPGCFIAWPDDLPEPLRYLALMRAMGIRGTAVRDDTLWFPLHDTDRDECAAVIEHHALDPARLVLVHPGSQLPSRRWPAERFAAVADALAAEGWQIAVTGTEGEREITAGVLGAMTQPAQHLAGETSLGALAALVEQARLVVCNDTGLSHVAAAMRTPSVVVASGSDTRRWAPLDHARHRVVADWPACRPCMFRECPYGHPCALNVSVERVAELAHAQLGGADNRHARWARPGAAPAASPTFLAAAPLPPADSRRTPTC